MPDTITTNLIYSIIFSVVFIPLGIALMIIYFPRNYAARRDWPITSGIITHARVNKYHTKYSSYQVTKISYDYQFMRQEYSGVQEIPFKRPYTTRQVISVHYNPTKPQESFVEQLLFMDIYRCIIALGFLILGILAIFLDARVNISLVIAFIVCMILSKLVLNAIWGHPGKLPR